MYEEECLWLVLSAKYTLTWAKWRKLQVKYSSLSLAFKDGFKLCPEIGLSEITISNYESAKNDILQYLKKLEVEWVSFLNPNYPVCFQNLSSPPIILYFKGNIELIQNPHNLAVIGSRRVTNYSKQVMQKLLPTLLSSSVNLVSGLAFGVDILGHQFSLQNPNSQTVAVLGGGVDKNSIYPQEHQQIAKQIIEKGGLLLSEYFPGKPAMPFQFPQRNRLIVAMSKAVWVVQAGMKSGTLLTAKIARDMGKDLLVTPASILEESYAGNHQILQDGAWPVTCSAEILSCLGLNSTKTSLDKQPIQKIDLNEIVASHNLSATQALTFKTIYQKQMSIEQILAVTNLNLDIVNSELGYLEILGLAENLSLNEWTAK